MSRRRIALVTIGLVVVAAAITDSDATLNLVLGEFASVTGQVVHARTGEALPGLRLMVMGSGYDIDGALASMFSPTKTDSSGRFKVERVAPGRQVLMVFDKSRPVAGMELELSPGQRFDVGTLRALPGRIGPAGDLGMRVADNGRFLRVAEVVEGGPAASAGIKVGAAIEAFDGKPVPHYREFSVYLLGGGVEAGQSVRLRLRGSSKEITLVARPRAETE